MADQPFSSNRISIVYKSNSQQDRGEKELPLKLLVLGDFSKKLDKDMFDENDTWEISNKNLDVIMDKMDINLKLAVKNVLTDDYDKNEKDNIQLNLKISSIKKFRPDSILDNVPPLKKLADLCLAIKTTQRLVSHRPALWERLKAATADETSKATSLAALRSAAEALKPRSDYGSTPESDGAESPIGVGH